MKIKIEFELAQREITLDYRPIFVSIIKKCLFNTYPDEYESFYVSEVNRSKSFTFMINMIKPEFLKDGIKLSDKKVVMLISSPQVKDIIILYNSFRNNLNLKTPLKDGNYIEIKSVKIQNNKKVQNNVAVIKFLSPLVIREHEKNMPDSYYIYNEEEFNRCLKEVLRRQLKEFKNKEVEIDPIIPKKTVVRCFGTNIRASLGIYKVSGEPEIINFLYEAGIGSRRNQGFGMFEIIG